MQYFPVAQAHRFLVGHQLPKRRPLCKNKIIAEIIILKVYLIIPINWSIQGIFRNHMNFIYSISLEFYIYYHLNFIYITYLDVRRSVLARWQKVAPSPDKYFAP